MSEDYERVLCVKNEVFIYKIPPRQSSRGHRAADWKLDVPDWTARLRITLLNNKCFIKFEERNSGELIAQTPVDQYPGPVVEAVADSSRYFVIRVQDESGRHAFIGMGFTDRGDSFDFNVALQDHFKREKQEVEVSKQPAQNTPALDLGFKEGQTIKINFGNKTTQEAKARPKSGGGSIGFLPPPPGGGGIPKLTPPLVNPPLISNPSPSNPPTQQQNNDWGDFASFTSSTNNSGTKASTDGGWVQF